LFPLKQIPARGGLKPFGQAGFGRTHEAQAPKRRVIGAGPETTGTGPPEMTAHSRQGPTARVHNADFGHTSTCKRQP
jgi:hypothetical protein